MATPAMRTSSFNFLQTDCPLLHESAVHTKNMAPAAAGFSPNLLQTLAP